jgi:formiminotetrahydrofolate cyclodeaminase
VTTPTAAGNASELGQLSVNELLDALEAPAPSPCGGSAAGLAAAMGAALVALAARQSTEWEDAPGVAAQATALRARLVTLAADDVRAYAAALEALSAAGGSEGSRDHLLGVALTHAADVPLAIARTASDVAELAALAAAFAKESLRADATTAAALAEAAARSAAHLVEINLASLPGDKRVAAAAAAADAAAAARERAVLEGL